MNKAGAIAALIAAMSTSTSAATLDIEAPGGHYHDCELVQLGKSGSLSGRMTLSRVAGTREWASALAILILGPTKVENVFRLTTSTSSEMDTLHVRHELFHGNRRARVKDYPDVTTESAVPFSMNWTADGRITLSAGGSEEERLDLGFSPERAFLLVSGGRGEFDFEGSPDIDCNRSIDDNAP
ncbi:hypothetical protein [Niveibacterium sp. COAC-50]|uniref:hypothetical protein n=1 Tax=Niveibacterium sp. COAC-50 TaxID=2729384 RepID=UPI00155520CF|nr:hypothetical protein [Niveibacterium sp. COAC-50]